ncbi:MAG: glycosyltransferase, partial [Rikenellaceae bacterium]|nr:glycosyltransferase [Rikenellaceae bacterium]
MDLSLVIPTYNEEESLRPLVQWIERVVTSAGLEWEALFIDDGSDDASWEVIRELHASDGRIKG